jgi:hypothetical protein
MAKKDTHVKAYFFHPTSATFFLDDFNAKFDEFEDIQKIGLALRPAINDLVNKIIKRFGNDSYILEEAMHLVEINDKGLFMDERDMFYEKQQFEYHKNSHRNKK